MKLIIEARVESEDAELLREPIRLAVVGRDDGNLEHLGFSLEEGRALMAAAQSALVSNQATQWLATQDYCRRCFTPLRHKDSRSIVVRTFAREFRHRFPRQAPTLEDLVASATEQCAPVLVKVRRRLTTSDRRQTTIAFQLGSCLDRLPLDEEELWRRTWKRRG
jgi:hypothetical protein